MHVIYGLFFHCIWHHTLLSQFAMQAELQTRSNMLQTLLYTPFFTIRSPLYNETWVVPVSRLSTITDPRRCVSFELRHLLQRIFRSNSEWLR